MRNDRCVIRSLAVIAVACMCTLFAGCSQGPETAEVKGKVTFQNQPVQEGSIQFLNLTEGGSFGGDLKPDGTYVVPGRVTPGDYTVILNPPIEYVDTDPGKSPPAPVEKNMPNIPPGYRMQGSSPLRAAVKPGSNEINFDMKADGT